MPKNIRKLIIPSDDDRICSLDGWELFDRTLPPGTEPDKPSTASPLWPSLKAVHVARRDDRRRGAGRRSYWLRYGVLAGRFRHCWAAKEFCTRFPAVYAAFEERCRKYHTVAKWKHRLGDTLFAQETARLEQSTAKGREHRAQLFERAHAAALEEDILWRRLYE